MNATEKKQFIRELCDNIKQSTCAKVSAMPVEWDGHELREYLFEQFRAQRTEVLSVNKSRGRAYRNAITITAAL